MKKKNFLFSLFFLAFAFFPCFANDFEPLDEQTMKEYKEITQDENLINAIELLSDTVAKYSHDAILGKNLTQKPIKVEFLNLATINPIYQNFDALGWKKKKTLYIYINEKHKDAPVEALCALLAHEAIHQDESNSLNEETYAWTLEAAVWTELTEANPDIEKNTHPLVERENTIKQLFLRGNYTNEYIHKFVVTNKGYKNLPERSYGFEELK